MLTQSPVSQNVIVTGLRGVGETVLLETLKPIAQSVNWLSTRNDIGIHHMTRTEKLDGWLRLGDLTFSAQIHSR